ncbi:MAG: segregation/condensation protein A [Candidatus Krumholzibacteriaceae bacterium]|jgi:segregation and condensation protein A
MTYQVRLMQFEGPLDLLLHLIRRDKINIYDIPISDITREYLAYIEIMQELELEVAGEFFVMAATLMRIKSQMLLPRHEGFEEEEVDPREELVRNLIEYRKFKEAATCFAEKEEDRRRVFPRPVVRPPEDEAVEEQAEVTFFDLVEALQGVFKNLQHQAIYRVVPDSVTVEQKIETIRGNLERRSELLFTELFDVGFTKIEIVVTFLALLEMIKLGELVARQMGHGADIWLYKPGARSYIQTNGTEHG